MNSDDVVVGIDGWMFLTGGSNETIRYYRENDYFSENTMQTWADLLNARQKLADDRSIKYLHLCVPEKISVYPEFFPDQLPYPDGGAGQRFLSFIQDAPENDRVRECFVEVTHSLRAAKRAESKLYWKTDTHWTFLGAYTAYLVLCKHLNAKPNEEIPKRGFNYGDLVLDLGGKLSPPVTERFETQHVLHNARRIYANPLVRYKEENSLEGIGGLHQGSSVVFQNNSSDADPRKVVIFGDSYSEYRPQYLTGILSETFSEVHFIWSAQIDWSYVDRVKPDILISELAERFMNYTPDDSLHLDTFVESRIAAHRQGG